MKALRSLALFAVITIFAGLNHDAPGSETLPNVRFQVKAITERAGSRQVLAETHIDGPPGTDFDIKLNDPRFKLTADFITDLIGTERVKLRVKLATKRLFGYSPRNLPIYEEDLQQHTLQVGIDETVELLPFGHNDAETLKIEIEPVITALPRTREQPLKIEIVKLSHNGLLNINARKMPHRFNLVASLRVDGEEVARGAAQYLLQEAQEIRLVPVAGAKLPELALSMSIDSYQRSRPADLYTINFDIYQVSGKTKAEMAKNWAGVGNIGEPLSYELNSVLPCPGRRCELAFTVDLAESNTETQR